MSDEHFGRDREKIPETVCWDLAGLANQVVFATAVNVLKQAGFALEDVTLPDRPYGEVYTCISNTEGGTNFKPLYDSGRMIQFYTPARRADWKAASMMPASDYLTALRIRAMIKMEADEVTSKYAVLIAPTSATGSGPIERRSDASGRAALPGDDRSVRKLNTIGNLSGMPGISIPCGFDGDRMPLALHIAGSAWDEQYLDVAMAFQRDTDWHRMRPEFRP